MTPEHTLAIEIMYQDLGMSQHEIVANQYWIDGPTLAEVEQAVSKFQRVTRFNPAHLMELRRNSVSHYLIFNGEKRTVAEWAYITGINERTLHSRIKRNWSDERVLTEKPKARKAA